MKDRDFHLQPFSSPIALPNLRISGSIARCCDSFMLNYSMRGDLDELSIPDPANLPSRRNGLWLETCFELFMAVRHDPRYWEVNVSPAGHWNVYRFAAYRQGMQEEEYFTELPISAMKADDCLSLSLELDLTGIVSSDLSLDMGVSAVVKQLDGATSYWALKHAAAQPDFHHRESFVIQL